MKTASEVDAAVFHEAAERHADALEAAGRRLAARDDAAFAERAAQAADQRAGALEAIAEGGADRAHDLAEVLAAGPHQLARRLAALLEARKDEGADRTADFSDELADARAATPQGRTYHTQALSDLLENVVATFAERRADEDATFPD